MSVFRVREKKLNYYDSCKRNFPLVCGILLEIFGLGLIMFIRWWQQLILWLQHSPLGLLIICECLCSPLSQCSVLVTIMFLFDE